MALIQWSSELEVGVTEIDAQHQKLVRMINDLNDAMRQGKGKDALGKILAGLATYAGVHFGTEEKYFAQFGYPQAPEHKTEHAAFTRKVLDFKAQFDAGKVGLSIEVMNFLSTWLQRHIKVVDKQYSAFFREKGLK
jgi:hemerythrin